jgi:DnaJ family protein C protein 17
MPPANLLTGPLDTTVRVRFALAAHPTLATPAAVATLLGQFGAVDAALVVLASKPPKKAPGKPPTHATAVVPFKAVGAAFAAVGASGLAARGLAGVDVSWAAKDEPPLIAWLKRMGQLGGAVPGEAHAPSAAPASSDPFSSFVRFVARGTVCCDLIHSPQPVDGGDRASAASLPTPAAAGGVDFESLTLLRMRQAEREQLEREIREQEAAEG